MARLMRAVAEQENDHVSRSMNKLVDLIQQTAIALELAFGQAREGV